MDRLSVAARRRHCRLHCYLVATGQTTSEKAKAAFAFASPYTRGCLGNLRELFCLVLPDSHVHIRHQPPDKRRHEAIVNKRKIVFLEASQLQLQGAHTDVDVHEEQKLLDEAKRRKQAAAAEDAPVQCQIPVLCQREHREHDLYFHGQHAHGVIEEKEQRATALQHVDSHSSVESLRPPSQLSMRHVAPTALGSKLKRKRRTERSERTEASSKSVRSHSHFLCFLCWILVLLVLDSNFCFHFVGWRCRKAYNFVFCFLFLFCSSDRNVLVAVVM